MQADTLLRLLGIHVREARRTKGWSQEELAARCRRHFTYIGRIERGQQNVSLVVLNEIARALGATTGELLTFERPALLDEWQVTANDIIEAVGHVFRAKVDVKGKLAEWMLHKELARLQRLGLIRNLDWLDRDNAPDFIVEVGGKPISIQCKNVRSLTPRENPDGRIRVELQKTRNSKDGSNSRAYGNDQFDVLSACLFNRTGSWEFLHIAVNRLETRPDNQRLLEIMQTVPRAPEPPWRGALLDAIKDRS